MSNCLFEGAYEEVLRTCKCTPSFHPTGIRYVTHNTAAASYLISCIKRSCFCREYPQICTGKRLKCMTGILHRIGKYNKVRTMMLAFGKGRNPPRGMESRLGNRLLLVEATTRGVERDPKFSVGGPAEGGGGFAGGKECRERFDKKGREEGDFEGDVLYDLPPPAPIYYESCKQYSDEDVI